VGRIADRVYATLRRKVLAGEYAPGMQLKEEVIAAEVGASRTPVRAALQRLTADGLLRSEPNRSAAVAPWTDRDINELFTLRILLEGEAAAGAAVRATDEQIERMAALTDEMEQQLDEHAPDFQGRMQIANRLFHLELLQAGAGPRLRAIATTLIEVPLIAFYLYDPQEIAASVQHHRDLVRALQARNPDWARAVMAVHYATAREAFRRSRRSTRHMPIAGHWGVGREHEGEADLRRGVA
jgi:DNA-binding GntR family transcriptional regulator